MAFEREGAPPGTLEYLLQIYGSLDSIPDADLDAIGFERIGPGQVSRKGEKERRQEKEKAGERAVEEKAERSPFREITLEFSRDAVAARYLSPEETRLLLGKLEGLLAFAEAPLMPASRKELKTVGDSLTALRKTFQISIADKIPQFSGKEKLILSEEIFLFKSLEILSDNIRAFLDRLGYPDKFLYDHGGENAEGAPVIPSAKSKELIQQLERHRGYFGDSTETRRSFLSKWHADIDEASNLRDFAPQLKEYCESIGLKRTGDVILHFFSLMLADQNMPGLAKAIKGAAGPDEALEALEKGKQEALQGLKAEERRIKSLLAETPRENKDSLATLNKELYEVSELIKKRTVLVAGLREYFSLPEITSAYLDKKIKDLQRFLSAGRGEKESLVYSLDAVPDPELDRDPGEVSGDCTAGKPLPFEDPNIPLYNVKVRDEEKRHMGNIYLLVTKGSIEDAGATKKAWHLEAIQIPSTIDWERGVRDLISRLASEAEKSGVDMITVNDFPEHISNYDYVRDAVIKYHEERGGKTGQVEFPEVPGKKYSAFQGTGEALVLWEK